MAQHYAGSSKKPAWSLGAAQVEQLEELRRNEEGYGAHPQWQQWQEPASGQQPPVWMEGVGQQQQHQMGSRGEQAVATQGQQRVNQSSPTLQDENWPVEWPEQDWQHQHWDQQWHQFRQDQQGQQHQKGSQQKGGKFKGESDYYLDVSDKVETLGGHSDWSQKQQKPQQQKQSRDRQQREQHQKGDSGKSKGHGKYSRMEKSLDGQSGVPDHADASSPSASDLRRHKWINRQVTLIADRGNLLKLLQTIQFHISEMNGINLATALHRVTKLAVGPNACLTHDALMRHPSFQLLRITVADHMEMHKQHVLLNKKCPPGVMSHMNLPESTSSEPLFEVQCLSIICWSCATLRLREEKLLATISEVVLPSLDELKPFELSNVLWAYAKFTLGKPALLNAVSRRMLAREEGEFSMQCLSMIVWSFATEKHRDGAVFASIAKEIVTHASATKPQEIANTLWAYAKNRCLDTRLFKTLAETAIGKDMLWAFKAQELSNTVWAFATISQQHELLFKHVVAVAISKRCELSPQNIANILWAYAKLQVGRRSGLFPALLPVSVRMMPQHKPHEISAIVWAAARENDPACRRFFGATALMCAQRLHEFAPQALASLVEAFAIMEADSPSFYEAMAHETIARMHQFEPLALSHLFRGVVLATRCDKRQDVASEDLYEKQLSLLDAIGSQLACRMIDLQPTELGHVKHSLQLLGPMPEDFAGHLQLSVRREPHNGYVARDHSKAPYPDYDGTDSKWDQASGSCSGALLFDGDDDPLCADFEEESKGRGGGRGRGGKGLSGGGYNNDFPSTKGKGGAKNGKRLGNGSFNGSDKERYNSNEWQAAGSNLGFVKEMYDANMGGLSTWGPPSINTGWSGQGGVGGEMLGAIEPSWPSWNPTTSPQAWNGFPGIQPQAALAAESWNPPSALQAAQDLSAQALRQGPLQSVAAPYNMLVQSGADASAGLGLGPQWQMGPLSVVSPDDPPIPNLFQRSAGNKGSRQPIGKPVSSIKNGYAPIQDRLLENPERNARTGEDHKDAEGFIEMFRIPQVDVSALLRQVPGSEKDSLPLRMPVDESVLKQSPIVGTGQKVVELCCGIVDKRVVVKAMSTKPDIFRPQTVTSHPNVLAPCAVLSGTNKESYVCYDFCQHGNLYEKILAGFGTGRPTTPFEAARIAHGVLQAAQVFISSGMSTASIRSDEIFVDEDGEPRVRVRLDAKDSCREGAVGQSAKWLAPEESEVLAGVIECPPGLLSWPSVVFRIGLLLYCMGAQTPDPYPHMRGELVFAELRREVAGTHRPHRPNMHQYKHPENLRQLVEECLASKVGDRPDYETVGCLLQSAMAMPLSL